MQTSCATVDHYIENGTISAGAKRPRDDWACTPYDRLFTLLSIILRSFRHGTAKLLCHASISPQADSSPSIFIRQSSISQKTQIKHKSF